MSIILDFSWNNCLVCNLYCCWVVYLDRALWLQPPQVWGFAGGEPICRQHKECNKLSLSSQGNDKLDNGCYCKDRAVEAWCWIIFQEEDMWTCSAARSSFIEVACICMCAKYHVTRSVDNAVVEVCGGVVEERFNKLFHVYCCLSLSCADGIECYQQLIVDSLCIIQEGPNIFLNLLDAFWKQRSWCVFVRSVLEFLAICDWCCGERQKLRLRGHRPIQAEK